VLPKISVEYLNRLSRGETLAAIRLGAAAGDFSYGFE
jgi:hypothetical protein